MTIWIHVFFNATSDILTEIWIVGTKYACDMPTRRLINWYSLHKKWSFPLRISSVKRDDICRKLRIWSHLLMKSLMENFIFVQWFFWINEIVYERFLIIKKHWKLHGTFQRLRKKYFLKVKILEPQIDIFEFKVF